ncbi:MAG TPA: universal stress protein [Allosphingosinicella sp.]|nr:universal stress protein [Allosphingosinicella sp.]
MRDLLLHLSSYPKPTPGWAVLAAISAADAWEARLSVALGHVHVPRVSNFLADALVDAKKAIAAENAKSDCQAKALLETFASEIGPERRGDEILIECGWTATARELVRRARRYDLTILPKYGQPDLNPIAEGLIFESGRPVLLLPERGGAGHRFAAITIGWDGSRAAARALGDSLPLCRQAESVELVAVTGEKGLPADPGLNDIRHHLATHDVDASLVELPAQGLDAGSALLRHCADAGADLLVMGAYGHSRLREFVLGGATRSVLAAAEIPVLLSH